MDRKKYIRRLILPLLFMILVGCQVSDFSQVPNRPTSALRNNKIEVTLTAKSGERPTPSNTLGLPTQTPSLPSLMQTKGGAPSPYLCAGDREPVMIISKVDENIGFLFFQRTKNIKFLAEYYQPLAWSPSGKKLLVTSKTQDIYGISEWNGENLRVLPNPETGHICNYAWLTEDDLLVSVCTNEGDPMNNDDKTYIFNVQKWQYQKGGPDTIRRIQAVSPDGNIWFEQGDKLYMVRRDGTEKNTDFLPKSNNFVSPISEPVLVFSPSGDTLYYFKAEPTNGNLLYDLYYSPLNNQDLQQEHLLYHGLEGNNYALKISPDGKYMAVIVAEKNLYFINLKTSKVDYHWEWPEQKSWPPFFFWSPDSKSIGFSSGNDTDLLYEMEISTGKSQILLKDKGYMKIHDWKCFNIGSDN